MGQKGGWAVEYEFKLVGATPLLMHSDDVEAGDELKAWRDASENKPLFVPGDDRTPPWTWQTYLYSDGTHLVVPAQNIMISLRYAAAKITLKGQTTFKQLSQSGIFISSEYCTLLNDGKPVPIKEIHAARNRTFAEQKEVARKLGFDLLVKRAKVNTSKWVRVRAKFDSWSLTGNLTVGEVAITPKVLAEMFDKAGRLSGLCDWRPSSKISPGSYGMFRATLKQL